ncbi:MAG: GntR family transcriptional regulator [Candidatus Cryosericum sp.]|jgi:GntR family transcriptional regulator
MEFYINPYDGIPVYLQIIQQVKAAISMETMHAGDRLPTVRELAGSLAVNPNTVAKAYRDLERDGVVETLSGKGTFIKDGQPTRNPEHLDRVLDMLLVEARNAGLSIEDVAERLVQRGKRTGVTKGES